MNCRYCLENIDRYTEGRLGDEEKLSFESHLQRCPECREIMGMQTLAERIIRSEKKAEPGFYLTGKIMARIGSLKKENDRLLPGFLRPALATVSVAATILAGILIGSIPGRNSNVSAPIELVLMNDAEIEYVNIFSAE